MKYNPLLLIDFYKTCHMSQYPKSTTKIVSYFTPRMSRLEGQDSLIMFGLQGYIKEYLINAFNDNFFSQDRTLVLREYARVINHTLGRNIVDYSRIERLYDLGYLPIEINALAEGTRVPIHVPMFEITNTHPDFAWLVNTLETSLSCSLWHGMISANVGYQYRQIVNKFYNISVDDNIPRRRAMGDFSMRGQESVESAIRSSAAFCLSFVNTATVPAILYLEDNYNAMCESEEVAFGAISTEHSVMNSNYAVDGDEITMVKRLLTEIYPKNGFSIVSDSYDYWNMVDNIIPACKEEIMNHQGYIGIRGDSGDPVEITTETVFRLLKTFGYTVNSKGYKVLPPQIKVIYGDSITLHRATEIYSRLCEAGVACNNVILGMGSFSMQCLEDENGLNPYTRDTFSVCIKATYCEILDKPYPIFKNPKTDNGNFKKSQKGMCVVYAKEDGNLWYEDGFNSETVKHHVWTENLLKPVFRDGKMINDYSLKEIRNRLHNDKF